MAKIDFARASLSPAVGSFVAIFMRFEFALKESGFIPKEGDALVDWGNFTKKLGALFFEKVRQSGRAPTILAKPPQKQIARGSYLAWKNMKPPKNTQELFEAVRRVRNNLFHGGKSGDPDQRRNDRLIAEAKTIIEMTLGEMPEVRAMFEGRY